MGLGVFRDDLLIGLVGWWTPTEDCQKWVQLPSGAPDSKINEFFFFKWIKNRATFLFDLRYREEKSDLN